MCAQVCFIVSEAEQLSLSFHPPSLEQQFPESRPGNSASVSFAESQRGLWEGGCGRDGGWWFHAGVLKLCSADVANRAHQCATQKQRERGGGSVIAAPRGLKARTDWPLMMQRGDLPGGADTTCACACFTLLRPTS